MANNIVIKPFRYAVQKILPTIYDDSLSYYELLNKVVFKLNEVIENENNLSENFNTLQENFNLLKAYVENYFDNLDVQEEINNKLDEMAENGTLQALLGNIISKQIQPMSTGTLNKIIECYKTYEKIDFVYGHNTAIRPYENPSIQPYEIDCSTLVMLCLMGVPFKQSRYNNINPRNNTGYLGYSFTPYKTKTDEDNGIYSTTYQFAEWCSKNGYGFYPNEGGNNIKPGDILFFNTEEDEEERFLGIDHCELNLGVYNKGKPYNGKYPDLLTLNASSGRDKIVQCNRRVADGTGNSLLDKLVYCARIPIDKVESNQKTYNNNFNRMNTGNIDFQYDKYAPFQIEVNATLNTENGHITVYMNNAPIISSKNIDVSEVGKESYFKFTLSGEYVTEDSIKTIRLSCVNDTNGIINNVKIAKGLIEKSCPQQNFMPTNMSDIESKFKELTPNIFTNVHEFIIGSLTKYDDINNNFKESGVFEILYNGQSNYGFVKFTPYSKKDNNVYWYINDCVLQAPVYEIYPFYTRPTEQISPIAIVNGWLEFIEKNGVYNGIIDLTLLSTRPDNFYLRLYTVQINYQPLLKKGFVIFESFEDETPTKYKIENGIIVQ